MNDAGNVLIVDDEPSVGEILVYLLKEAGISAQYAQGAIAARHRLETNGIDIVIADVKMKGEGGESLASWIQSHHSDIEVALMSEDESDYTNRYPFFQKPIRANHLVAFVRGLAREVSVKRSLLEHSSKINDIHSKVESWTVRHFIAEFCKDAIGRVLILVVISVVGYGMRQAEGMDERVRKIESTVQETAVILKQIGGNPK